MVIRRTFSRGNVGPSFTGRAYSYENEKGHITASWPKKRGKPRTTVQAQNQELFRLACIAMKEMNGAFLANSIDAVKGTPFLPRDPIMAALWGHGPTIHLPDGRTIRPMAVRVDMSSVMDNIAWREGSILVRRGDLWEGLDPPTEHSILVYDPVQGPLWVDSADFGSSGVWLIPYGTNTVNLSKNLKGNAWRVFQDTIIDMLQCKHSIGAGTTFRWFLARMLPNDTIDQVLIDQPHPTPAIGGAATYVYTLPAGLTLLGGSRYLIGIYVPGAAANNNTPLFQGSLMAATLSVEQDQARYAEATNTPGIGTVMDFDSATALYCIGFRGR